jgi:hypothetical protein
VQAATARFLRSFKGTAERFIHKGAVPTSAERRLEDFALRTGFLGYNPPARLPGTPERGYKGVSAELLQDSPEDQRSLFRPSKHKPFELVVQEYSDLEILDLIRQNIRWLAIKPVNDRIRAHQTAILSGEKGPGRKGRSFMAMLAKALANPIDQGGRPRWYDLDLLKMHARINEQSATAFQEKYCLLLAKRFRASLASLVWELRAELDGVPVLEGPTQQAYDWLGTWCAVIESPTNENRKNSALVHLGMRGWPHAMMLAVLSSGCGLSARAIREALGQKRRRAVKS